MDENGGKGEDGGRKKEDVRMEGREKKGGGEEMERKGKGGKRGGTRISGGRGMRRWKEEEK